MQQLSPQPSPDWPTPAPSERPTSFADRVGGWYASRQSVRHRKEHGLYLTPAAVASYMAQTVDAGGSKLRILDPAAGAGVLCCAVVEALANRSGGTRHAKPTRIEIVAHEVDGGLVPSLRAVLGYLAAWSRRRGVAVAVEVVGEDFIAAHACAVRANGDLLAPGLPVAAFDVVIANPPYFKLAKTDPRALALPEVVHGQPNIYALFMAVSAALLRQGGQLVFITPRSFASGPYFRRFRDVFFRLIQPRQVHVFRSRRSAFGRDDVLQENVILAGTRRDLWQPSAAAELTVTSSDGVEDMARPRHCTVDMGMAIDLQSTDKVLRLPSSGEDKAVMRLVDAWPSSLQALGLSISTGPVVPFRAARHIRKTGDVPATHAPLLWMNHVRPLQATWPLATHKPQYMERNQAGLLLPNRNYVLIRRFSAKEEPRRLTASAHLAATLPTPLLGLENHLNYIHRPGGELTEDETWGLATLYSSSLLDAYFRTINGNTQVSATELRAMPLPAHGAIVELGRSVRKTPDPIAAVDDHVLRLLAPNRKDRSVSACGELVAASASRIAAAPVP